MDTSDSQNKRQGTFVCPNCQGKKDFYAKLCRLCRSAVHGVAIWSDDDTEFLKSNYSTNGSQWVSAQLGKTKTQVLDKASKLGLVLTKEASYAIVHSKASEYMRLHNPSRAPGASKRISEQSKRNKQALTKLFAGMARLQKDKPSKPELKMREILEELGVDHRHSVEIKNKFVVDIMIGKNIIEVDGEWWHGHPRFEPLRPTQVSQRKKDAARNAYLETCGYKVTRVWERDITKENVEKLMRVLGVEMARD